MEILVNKLIVVPEREPIYHEQATSVEIDDESGGEYVKVSQQADHASGYITIEPAQWPFIRDAIEQMVKRCRS